MHAEMQFCVLKLIICILGKMQQLWDKTAFSYYDFSFVIMILIYSEDTRKINFFLGENTGVSVLSVHKFFLCTELPMLDFFYAKNISPFIVAEQLNLYFFLVEKIQIMLA